MSSLKLLKIWLEMLISSPLIGIATSLEVLEMPAFTLSPVHTGAVTAICLSAWVTRR